MEKIKYQVVGSTLGSLQIYEYIMSTPLKIGKTIALINSKNKKIKRFKIEYLKKIEGGYIIKNANNTLMLKRI